MGALLRWREPAVLVLLVLVAVRQLLAVAPALAALAGADGSYGLAGSAAAGQAGAPLALVLLAVLLVLCRTAPATPRARQLTVLGLAAVAVSVVVQLATAVLGLVLSRSGQLPAPLTTLSTVESLLDLVVPLLALLTLVVLLRPPARSADLAVPPALPAAEVAEPAPVDPGPDPVLQPEWQSDVAAGAAWLSAGDAASGRPPSAVTPVGEQDEPHPWASGPR
jgi:hypothetical protein